MSQSSALHRMAAGEHHESSPVPAISNNRDDKQFEHVDVESSAEPAAPTRLQTVTPRPQPRPADHSLKAMAVPVLAAVGGLLLIPAIWAVLILAGASVWQSDREGARTMALAMLAAWPIALCLIAGSGFFWWQVQKAKK